MLWWVPPNSHGVCACCGHFCMTPLPHHLCLMPMQVSALGLACTDQRYPTTVFTSSDGTQLKRAVNQVSTNPQPIHLYRMDCWGYLTGVLECCSVGSVQLAYSKNKTQPNGGVLDAFVLIRRVLNPFSSNSCSDWEYHYWPRSVSPHQTGLCCCTTCRLLD